MPTEDQKLPGYYAPICEEREGYLFIFFFVNQDHLSLRKK